MRFHVVGLVAPFCMALRGLLAKKGAAATSEDAGSAKAGVDALALSGAVGALIGGCALRFLVLAAGVHADVVAETIFKMINER